MDKVKRPLNYYGSKEKAVGNIHALIPPGIDTWVDVFCGSAIVTLSKPRHSREVINDLNSDVVNLFEVLRTPALAADLYARVELTPYSEEVLYKVYEAPPTECPVERAWRFLVTSWLARGGDAHKTGFRWSKNMTTSPERTWANLPKRLGSVADRLRGICIRHDDFRKIVADYDGPSCLLYVDPPYPGPVGRRYAVRMSDQDHVDLAEALRASRSKVIVSMNPDPLYDAALADWHRLGIDVLGGGNQTKREVMFCNFEPSPLFAGSWAGGGVAA
ncbi:DNA adenine methylase [Niveispirillum sp.]|uniref:DNA adenine methylase n=1 Tax=Niveispirillum sp. TaxID=1917217 RepID=UPI001B5F967C|nr:DNA adenine methylase [Niveispirillum sp.]MBP7339432.1 DNA adenine methylase [Niveispirillum sp.]